MLDRTALAAAVADVSTRMRSHAGGVEVVSAADDGRVELRFTGMCCGCPYKVLTWEATVEPALRAVPGVMHVDAPGVRVSDEARARLRAYVEEVRLS